MSDTGYTFEPGKQKKLLGGMNQGKLGPQANEALQVLALRLPEVLGGSPIAPGDLLRPRMGGAGAQGAMMDTLQRLFGGGNATPAPAALQAGPQAPGALNVANFQPGTPNITPGGDNAMKAETPTAQPIQGGPAGKAPMGQTSTPVSGGPVGSDPLTTLLRGLGPLFRGL